MVAVEEQNKILCKELDSLKVEHEKLLTTYKSLEASYSDFKIKHDQDQPIAKKLILKHQSKAISLNGNKGAYYLLLANIYAAAPRWNDDPNLNSCKYFVVLDKLYQAKRVDESVAEEANKMIAAYSTHTPAIEELFFLGKKKGDQVHVGGIINETTTIR